VPRSRTLGGRLWCGYLGTGGLLLLATRIKWTENDRDRIVLTIGLIVPIAAVGFVSQITLPLDLLVDLALALFPRRLWASAVVPSSDGVNLIQTGRLGRDD